MSTPQPITIKGDRTIMVGLDLAGFILEIKIGPVIPKFRGSSRSGSKEEGDRGAWPFGGQQSLPKRESSFQNYYLMHLIKIL